MSWRNDVLGESLSLFLCVHSCTYQQTHILSLISTEMAIIANSSRYMIMSCLISLCMGLCVWW